MPPRENGSCNGAGAGAPLPLRRRAEPTEIHTSLEDLHRAHRCFIITADRTLQLPAAAPQVNRPDTVPLRPQRPPQGSNPLKGHRRTSCLRSLPRGLSAKQPVLSPGGQVACLGRSRLGRGLSRFIPSELSADRRQPHGTIILSFPLAVAPRS